MNIAIISSSIRKERRSHAVAEELYRRLQNKTDVDPQLIDLQAYAFPLFEQLYTAEKASALTTELQQRLHKSAAMIFISPEYNGSYTAALKNMTDGFSKAEFSGKPIGVVSVSTGILGGMRGAQLMQQLVLGLSGYPIPQMLLVPEVNKKFNEQGTMVDAAFDKKISVFLDHFLWFTEAIVAKKLQDKATVVQVK